MKKKELRRRIKELEAENEGLRQQIESAKHFYPFKGWVLDDLVLRWPPYVPTDGTAIQPGTTDTIRITCAVCDETSI